MSRWGLLAILGALASQSALAADMPGTWAPPPAPPLLSPIFGTPGAWYVRADAGYYWGRVDAAKSAPGFPDPAVNDLGKGITAGIGVGYKANWVRTDVTVDYTGMTYKGAIAAPADTTAKIGAITALFNGYLDLGTWYGLTPYVGAGAGVARLTTSDYTSTLAPPFTPGLSNTQWRFAWALMGGFAYTVTPNLAVDLGYRYMDFGDVDTAADAAGAMTLKNLAAHEVRVGVRWSFDDPPRR